MDLMLLDLILKGRVPKEARILDAGCGEGRNAIYFIKEGYDYLGVDRDPSKIQLAQYFANNISTSNAKFQEGDIKELSHEEPFDFIVCSRVLHFAESKKELMIFWQQLVGLLVPNGIIYVTMDSVIDNHLGHSLANGKHEFPDGSIKFVLTQSLFEELSQGFEVIDPLKTLVQNNARAQSFFTLKKL